VPAVVMHNQRGRSASGGRDVIGDIRAGLEESIAIAEGAGLPRQRLIIDPGFGFGWTPEQNLEQLRRLEAKVDQLSSREDGPSAPAN